MTRETASVVLTPPGRGAVATVLVQGPQATDVVGNCFQSAAGKPLADFATDRIVFGNWGGPQGEELVVCRRSEQSIEIHCHGGQAAVAALIESLEAAGCRNVAWQTWFRSHAASLRSQALEALALAATERTASILLDQYAGALQSAVESILTCLQAVDRESLAEATRLLETLHQHAAVGRRLIEPCRIVLAGCPNVGKSSLINALAGYRRSIVYDQPGTTRDVVTTLTALAGWPVQLADTAGLRDADDELEAAGVTRARATLADADIQVLVFDSTSPWSEADDALRADWPDALIVHNKADLSGPPSLPDDRRPAGLATSATQSTGIEELARLLGERIVPAPPPAGAPVPFLPAHFAAVKLAREQLAAGDAPAAAAALRAII
ncbi:MAG TPA: GTPase [Pirellulales bacterium]|nr:GTPase [Pirellulales bacterium]